MSAVPTKYTGTLSGTSYVPDATATPGGIPIKDRTDLTFVIDHPGSVTTAYTIQVSNMTDEEVNAGTSDWTAYDVISELSLATDTNDFIEFVNCAFMRVRLKQVTTVGSGSNTVRTCQKGVR
jgi:hypothetical protein